MVSDNLHAVGMATGWLASILYPAVVEQIHMAIKVLHARKIETRWYWVPSHVGISNHDKADHLAVEKRLEIESKQKRQRAAMSHSKKRTRADRSQSPETRPAAYRKGANCKTAVFNRQPRPE